MFDYLDVYFRSCILIIRVRYICRFDYNASSEVVKEIQFEEVEGKLMQPLSSAFISPNISLDHNGTFCTRSLFSLHKFQVEPEQKS